VGRLFWTFPDGLPGAGLLLLRLALGGAVLSRWLTMSPTYSPFDLTLRVSESLAALLLCVGLGAPVWGAGAAAVEVWRAYSDPQALLVHIVLAAVGGALALLGPGAFSIDACIFGWRRIEVRPSKGPHDHPN
jgi:hypothetical protein